MPPASLPAAAAMSPGPMTTSRCDNRSRRRDRTRVGAATAGAPTVDATSLNGEPLLRREPRFAHSCQSPPHVHAALGCEGVDQVVGEDPADGSVILVDDHERRAPLVDEAI